MSTANDGSIGPHATLGDGADVTSLPSNGTVPPSTQLAAEPSHGPPARLPVIVCNSRHLRVLTEQALEAIKQTNSPASLFQMGGNLARIRVRNGEPEIEIMGLDAMRGYMGRSANCVKAYPRKDDESAIVPIFPPLDVVRDLLSLPHWPTAVVPELKALVRSPAFTADGKLISVPGFHPKHGIYYSPAARRNKR